MTSTLSRISAGRSAVRSPGGRSIALVVILVCQLMVVLDATIVNIALPDIQKALHFNSTDLSWVISAYALAFGGLLLLGARAGDLFGRRRVFLGGIALFTLASLAGGFADSPTLLLAARAVQGAGGAFASPSALALLMITYSEGRERTRALGYYTAVSIGGSAVGLIAGGLLTEWASWRWVFFVNVPIGMFLLVIAARVLPETDRRRGKVDMPGAITSTLGMSAVVYGITRASTYGWGDAGTIASLFAGVALLGAFAVLESHTDMPITPLSLFADRSRVLSYLARLALVAGMFGMFFFLTQFMQDVLHYSAISTGLAFLPLTLALFLATQLSARGVYARFNSRVILTGGVVLSGLGMLWLTQLTQSSSYLDILGPVLMVGFGNGTAFLPLTTAALSGVAPADAGAASGLVNVMQQVGGALGLAVLVTVFGSASRSAARHPLPGVDPARHAFVVGAQHAFAAAAVAMLVSAILTLFMRRTEHNPSPKAIRKAAHQQSQEPEQLQAT